MLTTLTFCKWVTGREMKPRAVSLAYPEPASPAPYALAFSCPIAFDALVNAIEIAGEDLDAPMPGHNPKLASVHHEIMSQRLALIEDDNIVVRVEEAIKARLVNGAPLRREIAEALGMSERTLQRRLRERATSFNQAFDETRRNLAFQLLGKPKFSYAEIAYLLGFTEQSVFFRACKRWFKASPARVRQNILNPPKSDLA
jgi:AraC-like DNA-binding protein